MAGPPRASMDGRTTDGPRRRTPRTDKQGTLPEAQIRAGHDACDVSALMGPDDGHVRPRTDGVIMRADGAPGLQLPSGCSLLCLCHLWTQ